MIFRVVFLLLYLTNLVYCQNYDQKIYPNDPNPGVFFGRYLNLNGNNAFISAYQDFENGSSSGSLYIFNRLNDKYKQTIKVFPDDGGIEEFFSYSVSSFDNWVITGAHHDSDFGASSGSAYILNKPDNSQWSFYQKLVPFDAAEADEFGKKVDIYKDDVVVCSYLDDDKGINSGSVYIYKWNGESWVYIDKIYASDSEEYSQFGLSLDLYKDKLIIGSPFKNSCGIDCGAAYIFEKINNEWVETAILIPDELDEKDEFGINVKIKDEFAFISSIKDDDNGENSGSVYVYKKELDTWVYTQKLSAFDADKGDAFGIALDFNDSLAIIGAYFDDDNGENSGSVYIYKRDNDTWRFAKKVTPEDGDESDAFGSSISLDNNKVLIGAYSDDDNGFFSGAAYLFSLDKILTKTTYIEEPKIDVYPNVFENNINIVTNNLSKALTINLFDVWGNVILSQHYNSNHIVLHTTKMRSGVYFLQINNGKKINTFKLVKN